jgi:putative oxidoreductase
VSSTPIDVSRLLLRFGVGLIFLFTGIQKVLPGTAATVDYFSQLGIPWPTLLGPFVSYLELLGAFLLILGLLTRLLSALFISEMLVVLLVVRLPIAVDADSVVDAFAALRLELLIALAAGCLVLLGGGRWSLDAVVGRLRRNDDANGATGSLAGSIRRPAARRD